MIVLYTQMSSDSAVASFYINGDTLTYLGDLSSINLALARSLDRYAAAINSLAPLTSTPVLADATASNAASAANSAATSVSLRSSAKRTLRPS